MCNIVHCGLHTAHVRSGSQDGAVHLWTVQGKASQSDSEPSTSDQSESSIRVSHVTTLQGHQAPISVLAFSETAVLLASGCQAGSVRIWDLKVGGRAAVPGR